MDRSILSHAEYYERINAYMVEFGLPYELHTAADAEAEGARLAAIVGAPEGRAVLDCACGWSLQAVALAKQGWRVTAADIAPSAMALAREWARREQVAIDFQHCDMRDLAHHFDAAFDWAVSCYALYELEAEADVLAALRGICHALKPGGRCYLLLRDMDFLMEEQPRHRFHAEKRTPHGRIICISDWEFKSEAEVVQLFAFLREDERLTGFERWHTETIGLRKLVLRKAGLARLLREAGFDQVTFLPQEAPWAPFEVLARRPEA